MDDHNDRSFPEDGREREDEFPRDKLHCFKCRTEDAMVYYKLPDIILCEACKKDRDPHAKEEGPRFGRICNITFYENE